MKIRWLIVCVVAIGAMSTGGLISGGGSSGLDLTTAQTTSGTKTFSAGVVVSGTGPSGWGVNATGTNTALLLESTGGGYGLRYNGGEVYFQIGGANSVSINPVANSGGMSLAGSLFVAGDFKLSSFVDDSATTGNRTVNATRGFNAYAAAATAITITNSTVSTTSQIVATVMTNDATAYLRNCVPAAGSFTCTLGAAATGTTKIAWTVIR